MVCWNIRQVSHRAPLHLLLHACCAQIVVRKRGGYCFELNTLFAALLTGLGYAVRTGAARVVLDGLQVTGGTGKDHGSRMYAHLKVD